MPDKLLICTDLDRTLIANGPEPESPQSSQYFKSLCLRDEVTLAYVSGRDRVLVEQAIHHYQLPVPDFVIGDVGTTIYQLNNQQDWQPVKQWELTIARDWNGKSAPQLQTMLCNISELRPQETHKQNTCKLSYYVPVHCDHEKLSRIIQQKLGVAHVNSRLIWSMDELNDTGLLDILPSSASKYHAIEALMKMQGFDINNCVFCGDSGNDIEVLVSPIPSVLVGNSKQAVRERCIEVVTQAGRPETLYIATGGFMGMNGNYSAGMLEGIAYFYPQTLSWIKPPDEVEASY